jgi:hypothetical protein
VLQAVLVKINSIPANTCKTWIVNNELSNVEKWAQADIKEFILSSQF